jgi:hypothetical protein
MKISRDTRDRLRALGADGESLEDVVVAALDVYETADFWQQAADAAATESDQQRRDRTGVEREFDAWADGLG